MTRVLIIQAQTMGYRFPFFTQLHGALKRDDIELKVAYSPPHGVYATLTENAELPPDCLYKVKAHWLAGRMIYQPLWREIARADLVITGHENKYLMNLWLFLLSALRLKRVALWGLGEWKEEGQSRLSGWLREKSLQAADWYFAYTQGIVPYLQQHGVTAERITIVQNATDTAELRRLLHDITDEEAAEAKRTLTGDAASRIGFYCGMLVRNKALPFLLESAHRVRQQCPDFHLVIMGSGPERAWLEQAIAGQPWIHYVGSKYGRESALFYKMADVFLLAGTAGLAVVDSFGAGLPLIATELPTHPPEVDYLCDGKNGRMTPHDPGAYAQAIVEVLTRPALMSRLRQGAIAAGSRYTMEAMVENFRAGIINCLAYRGSASQFHQSLNSGDLGGYRER
jgi:glycosyltransferase involved in cell wall biosynthesis